MSAVLDFRRLTDGQCLFVVMRFYLVYSGPLRASGNKPKPKDVAKVRDALHPQLEFLWQTHTALQQLRRTARVPGPEYAGRFMANTASPYDDELDITRPLQEGFVDLTEPKNRGGKTYHPLVTQSLNLTCSLDILFLRQEDPGSLIHQGGDLDNRIKALIDALKIPNSDVAANHPQAHDPLYCLLEEDTLVSDISVNTGRLLFPQSEKPCEVHLVIEVTIRVLKLGPWNVCLMGN